MIATSKRSKNVTEDQHKNNICTRSQMLEAPEAPDDVGAYSDGRLLHFCFVLALQAFSTVVWSYMSATLKLNIGMMSYIFPLFCACKHLDRSLELYVSYVKTQHRNDELHFLLRFGLQGLS